MIARFRFAPLLAVGLLLSSGSLVTFGCSRQPEGERCSLKNADLDCNGELSCTPSTNLRFGSDKVDRCCPDTGFNDTRCTPGRSTGTGGSSGLGGEGGGEGGGDGQGGAGGAGNGQGETCNYNSECKLPLVCKTTCPETGSCANSCEFECNEDRDCLNGFRCTANSCVLKL